MSMFLAMLSRLVSPRGGGTIVALAFLFFLVGSAWATAPRVVEGMESWSGKVVLAGDLLIPAGAALTLQPGTELRFPANATLTVEGRFTVRGTVREPVVLRPAGEAGNWQGLSIHSGGEPVVLEHLQILGASQALVVTESKVTVADALLSAGGKGIVSGLGAHLTIDRVTISDMQEGGIEASVRSQVQINACRLERIAGFGIQAGQQARVLVRNTYVADAKLGILISGDFPPLEENVLERCELGIGIAQAGPSAVVRKNRISGGKVGIACQQFASPTIENNTVSDCDEGLTCIQGASPLIRQNLFSGNRRAISCVQMCYPKVTRNVFAANTSAIYLHLSSYPRIYENNFVNNRLHIELDNMSYDWEQRAGMKPTRNRQKQSEIFMRSGRAAAEAPAVDVESEGFVDARGNYWGEETTREIAVKGVDANLEAIADAFDIPVLSYDGWPGEYKKDRVRYDGWKSEPIAGVGP